MMILSDEQMRAATHGRRDDDTWWRWYSLPVGPQEIPSWCAGAAVEWYDGYSNPPALKLKVRRDKFGWEQTFKRNGSVYSAEHPDGRLKIFHHDGAVRTYDDVKAFRGSDGKLNKDRRRSAELWPDEQYNVEPGYWVETNLRATSKQEGFGGDNIWLMMDDEQILVLRGPWHGGPPAGYEEVSYWSDDMVAFSKPGRNWRPWWKRGGIGGLFISQDLYVRLIARFQAHLRVALVKSYSGSPAHIQPLKPEWNEPKSFRSDRHGN